MSEYTNKGPTSNKTIISDGLSQLQKFHGDMKKKFVFAGAIYTEVIREMIVALEKQKQKESTSIEYIQYKESQIDKLADFYNVCEEILEKYRQQLTALQISNDIIEKTFLQSKDIDEMILNNKQLREEFLKL